MDELPIAFQLKGQGVLVVGGGTTALRKLRLLVKTSAEITVIASTPNSDLISYAVETGLRLIKREFSASDLSNKVMVISATDEPSLDNAVSEAAKERNIPINVPDRPDLCTFHIPSIVDRDPIVIAISTSGNAPVLARHIRERIEKLLPKNIGKLAKFAREFRSAVKSIIPSAQDRLNLWESVLAGPISQKVLAGKITMAREDMVKLVNQLPEKADHGIVHIVGAGPGDPDLLTLRAFRLMQTADVIVYDRLVSTEILDLARRDADRIFVGKSKGYHHKTQEEINQILATEARAGKRVIRLKGGDPFLFGRGGEEMKHLHLCDIPVEIVPGITAATGCAASLGIPLTHRGIAAGVTFITGHGFNGAPNIDWTSLSRSANTIVIYMGLSRARAIADNLITNGMRSNTPFAVIENGTRTDERTIVGVLGELPQLISEHDLSGPSLLIIGKTVNEMASSISHDLLSDLPQAIAV
ncbi:MAG: uroporphyrinogen-III C-methyltransferase [Rhodospirillaceae bacterium]|nr:uroporphyrinogen-III C-methyltransferase [Rhodospirillaceae bacterium]